ncbi:MULTISPECIES: hypothetical protein [unclassified Moorena]|uniref:hypothetical protein n=1 Tax=unclassified Moorena TaxID=2683338 RepID=UPI0013CBC47E|nr:MULTISPECIES: hypothetical protein [unclassified Moorena]NEO20995.1 hypothetical protein [Moorena sp. SIO4A5]NEQ58861.1 hypothetical protein [Moorena sp. SIO4A1]
MFNVTGCQLYIRLSVVNPLIFNHQPSNLQTINHQTFYLKPSTINHQTINHQPSNHQPSNHQPSTFNLQPSTFNLQPSTFKPSTFKPWPKGHALRSKAGLRPSRSTLPGFASGQSRPCCNGGD